MSNDVFPLLDLSELAICLQSCDFSLATEDNLSRPTSQCIITLYKQIIDSFMGISADSLINMQQNRSAQETGKDREYIGDDDDNDYGSYSETLQVLVLNKICYKFFQNIGVADFNIMDLFKPEVQRTRRLLSAVVNYARFREERMFDCNRFISQTEALLGQLRSKFDDYNLLQQQMKQYEEEEKAVNDVVEVNGDELSALESNNRNLEAQLKKLTQIQEALSIDYNNYKEEKQKMLGELESLGFQVVELEAQREKLQKYSETNMDGLEKGIVELQELLDTKQRKLNELETKQRNLHISTQTFQRVIEELYDILRIVSIELQESHKKETSLIELKQQLIIRRDKMENILSSGILLKLSILQEQLETQKKKLSDLLESSRTKSDENENQLRELKRHYREEVVPQSQKAETHIEKDLITGEVKDLEQKMHSLQVQFQQEIDAVELEYSLLAGHINKYMECMLEKMD